MATGILRVQQGRTRLRFRPAAIVATLAAFGLSACAGMSDYGLSSLAGAQGAGQAADKAAAPDNRSDLEKATEYWGKEYAKNEKSTTALLSYVRNLRALGQKQQALAVLQSATLLHGTNREYLGEYGRAALEADQTGLALKMLEQADNPAQPDWRIINARGTALAKLTRYNEAIPILERAHMLAPTQPSVANNLALAYTMNGQADKAEVLLRQASTLPNADVRVRQNLALVLGLQGKNVEARTIASQDLAPEQVNANMDFLRKMVKAGGDDAGAHAAPGAAVGAGGALPAQQASWAVEVGSPQPAPIPVKAQRPRRAPAQVPVQQAPVQAGGNLHLRPTTN